jgi:transposase InsO family protein
MIDRDHELSIVKQAEVLNLSRGSVYYKPRPLPERDLALMRRIDELHLDYPFVGRPNQVWAMDITYVPMARGYCYLAAVMDWFSRKVLA